MVLVIGCVIGMLVPAAAAGRTHEPDSAELNRFLASALDETGLPGMAVAVTRGPDMIYLKGFGSDGHGHGITPGTQFRIASLSKSFTAVAVLQLAEAGQVELDAPVQAYLPNFVTADPSASRRITVRHLLNQTSGMADAGFPAIANDQSGSLEQRMESLRGARLVSDPGQQFHYFDPNYQLLARLVEVVAGVPFSTYLRNRVLTPLGMTHTFAADTSAQGTGAAPGLAQGHILVFGPPVARPELDGLLAGSGGIISTANDMARWLIMQSTGGRPLLQPASVELMHTPPPRIASSYGQGWEVVTPTQGPRRIEHRRIEHSGVLSTFSADQVLLPDSGYAFTLLYNGNSALADTAGVKAALAALLTDGHTASVRSTRLVALVLGTLTVAVVALRMRNLLRLQRWTLRRQGRPWWRAVPGISWLLLPTGLLLGTPALLLVLIGRSFTFWQLCLAMPDVMIFLTVAAATGTAVAASRVIALLVGHIVRQRLASTSTAP